MKISPTRQFRREFAKGTEGAFSLLEILCVVAVIAIIAALLFPGLQKSREKAALAGCLNNLRTWGLANGYYASDHNGEMVMNEPLPPSGTGDRLTWQAQLCPYIDASWLDAYKSGLFLHSAMACPSEWRLREDTAPPYYCYGMNKDLNNRLYGEKARVRFAALKNATQYVVLGDTFDTATLYNDSKDKLITQSQVNRRHGGNPNFLYADGHAAPMALDQLRGTSDSGDNPTFFQLMWYANGLPPNKR